MPRNSETPVCGISNIKCCREAKRDMIHMKFEESKLLNKRGTRKSKCNCLPSCTSIEYDTEITQAQFETQEMLDAYGVSDVKLEG